MVALRRPPRRPPRRPRRRRVRRAPLLVLVLVLVAVLFLLLLGALRLGRLELGGDERVVLGAQIDLVVEVNADPGLGVAVRLQPLLTLEGLDLLDRHLELVGDPGIGAALPDPGSYPVQLGA